MNRESKYRGKRLDTGEWIIGGLVKTICGHCGITIMTRYDPDLQNIGALIAEVDPATVGEYTGLKDKNGREIFDGDVIHCEWNPEYIALVGGDVAIPFDAKIVWDDDSAGFMLHPGEYDYYLITEFITEVIANIHDNRELIKPE